MTTRIGPRKYVVVQGAIFPDGKFECTVTGPDNTSYSVEIFVTGACVITSGQTGGRITTYTELFHLACAEWLIEQLLNRADD